jgi:myo-inositol-1-phosphate synthase
MSNITNKTEWYIMSKTRNIKVAIAGIGNCAQALVTGIEYYRKNPEDTRGLMNVDISGYKVTDIEVVAAFDINADKVGKDISEAVYARPNRAYIYPNIELKPTGVIVQKGNVFDGNPPHLNKFYALSEDEPCDVVKVLKESGAQMLLNFIPTESHQAARFYADASIKEAKIGFVNGMPTLIVCDPEYQKAAIKSGVPLIGDDVKSQFGGTAIHRALATLMNNRGIHLSETYQLNFAGNTDFVNLMARGKSKHKTKQDAVTSLMPYPVNMSTGFTYVELMKDRKTSYFWINGSNFGNAPLHLEAKLEVEDSANFAGVIVDMVRYMRLAADREISGVLDSACSFLTKHPPVQILDIQALENLKEYIEGKRER